MCVQREKEEERENGRRRDGGRGREKGRRRERKGEGEREGERKGGVREDSGGWFTVVRARGCLCTRMYVGSTGSQSVCARHNS